MKRLLLVVFALYGLISACSTDFEINADWKEITVVYGLLDQNDSVHYIKVTKAFLGSGNALAFAQNPDSSSYGNNIEVKVQEYSNGVINNEFYLDTLTVFNKEEGAFYYPKQLVYWFKNKNLNPENTYKLVIKNKLNGKIISSETQLVRDFSVIKPSPSSSSVMFHTLNPVIVKWYSAKFGRLYQLIIRFNYKEENLATGITTNKYLDWNLGSQSSKGIDGDEDMESNYYGESFYSFLGNAIQVDPNIKRYTTIPNINFMFSVAGDDFATYMEVNKPSTDIIQERPEYTNINNGIGIFSSRFNKVLSFAMHPVSLDSLKNGRFTKKLNFN